MKGQPIVPPGGAFSASERLQPSTSSDSVELAFRCLPRVQPYLSSDDCESAASVLVDTKLNLPTATHFKDLALANSSLTINIDDQAWTFTDVTLDGSNLEFSISLCHLQPRKEPYDLHCSLELSLHDDDDDDHTNSHAVYQSSASLSYLPTTMHTGSITKIDRKHGALMIQSHVESKKGFEPMFPIGFYTDFGYLASNLSVLDEIKSQGFNFIHPVPPFGDSPDALEKVLDRMDEIGLYLVYDMRHTYRNSTLLAQEIHNLKSRQSLLLWYTADEPDGPSDPLNASREAYEQIYDLDGGYHPISLALNCADYHFTEYAAGADIIMPDVYMVGLNDPHFSSKYGTKCTKDFGCCGCDNCEGQFEDLSSRLDDVRERLRILAWDRSKFIWTIPQAFGSEEFWSRAPTGREWLVQAILGINHGARGKHQTGIMPWIDPTPPDIKKYASRFAKLLPQLTPYIFGENITFSQLTLKRVDIGIWKGPLDTLILATNLDENAPAPSLLKLDEKSSALKWLLREGVTKSLDGGVSFEPLGSAVVISSLLETDAVRAHDEL